MKTAIPSTVQSAPTPAKNSSSSFPTHQSGHLAQLAAMMNQGPRVQAQLKLKDEIHNSEQVQRQMSVATEINRQSITQLQLIDGESAQQEAAPASNRIGLSAEFKAGLGSPSGIYQGTKSVQRKIKYGTSKLFGDEMEIKDMKTLVGAIQNKFPRFDEKSISDIVDEIEKSNETWTLADVHRHFAAEHKKLPVEIGESEQNEDIRLPAKENGSLDFGFTTRTRLTGKIIRSNGEQVGLPEFTQKNEDTHAEDQLMKYLDGQIESNKVDPDSDTIIITINNSPCDAKCAHSFSKWKLKNWKGKIIVCYANPHGTVKEFINARQALRSAGITVTSFEPLSYVDSEKLTETQELRFKNIKTRRKRYRKKWNEEHPSDESSDTEGEQQEKQQPRSEKRKRRSHSPSDKKSKKQKVSTGESGEESSEAVELDPGDWDGKSLPDEALKLFITEGVRNFNIGGFTLIITYYSEKDGIKYRIGRQGG